MRLIDGIVLYSEKEGNWIAYQGHSKLSVGYFRNPNRIPAYPRWQRYGQEQAFPVPQVLDRRR